MCINEPIHTKIRIPFFSEIAPIPVILPYILGKLSFGILSNRGNKSDYIIIEKDILKKSNTTEIFLLSAMKHILFQKTQLSCITKDFKLDPCKPCGETIGIFLVDKEENKHLLLPVFCLYTYDWGKKELGRFINELSKATNLPIEENSIKEV